MEIIFTKGEQRHRILCRRMDGTTTATSINAQLPAHDLAHYIVESELKMQAGFYGNIAAGYSIEQLSDKAVIARLPPESMVAEVLTRAMQGMTAPNADARAYLELVNWELDVLQLPKPDILEERVTSMAINFQSLMSEWETLSLGEQLKLDF